MKKEKNKQKKEATPAKVTGTDFMGRPIDEIKDLSPNAKKGLRQLNVQNLNQFVDRLNKGKLPDLKKLCPTVREEIRGFCKQRGAKTPAYAWG